MGSRRKLRLQPAFTGLAGVSVWSRKANRTRAAARQPSSVISPPAKRPGQEARADGADRRAPAPWPRCPCPRSLRAMPSRTQHTRAPDPRSPWVELWSCCWATPAFASLDQGSRRIRPPSPGSAAAACTWPANRQPCTFSRRLVGVTSLSGVDGQAFAGEAQAEIFPAVRSSWAAGVDSPSPARRRAGPPAAATRQSSPPHRACSSETSDWCSGANSSASSASSRFRHSTTVQMSRRADPSDSSSSGLSSRQSRKTWQL